MGVRICWPISRCAGGARSAIGIVPVPLAGQPVAGAVAAAVTTAVGTEVPSSFPSVFVRGDHDAQGASGVDLLQLVRLRVRAADVRAAAAVLVAAPPLVREVIGAVPVNVPSLDVSVDATFVVPEIVGGTVLFGATLLAAWTAASGPFRRSSRSRAPQARAATPATSAFYCVSCESYSFPPDWVVGPMPVSATQRKE